MKINPRKLPVKYALNVYKELSTFPSHEDLTYMLLSYLSEKDDIEKPFTPSRVWACMKDGCGTISELEGFLEYASDPVDCPGAFLQKLDMSGGKKPERKFKVINNPWI